MKIAMRQTQRIGIALLSFSLGGACCRPAPSVHVAASSDRVAISHDLPSMEGGRLTVKVIEVEYAPGDSSRPHRHPCPVIGYIIEGSLRSRVEGAADSVYNAGDSFYEAPNSIHAISGNASNTKPVRFLASFICDSDKPLSVPIPDSH